MDPKWRTFLVLLILLASGSGLILALGGDDGSGGSLKVEQAPTPEGGVELLATVPDRLNVPETAGGRTQVDLVCTNEKGDEVVRARQAWPLLKDGDPPLPHVHHPASPTELKAIARCRLVGTEPELSGELGLAR